MTKRLRCRAQVYENHRFYQCAYAAKPGVTRALKGAGGRVDELPVCGVHARNSDPGQYFQLRMDPYHLPVVLEVDR